MKTPCFFVSVMLALLGISGTRSFGYEFEVDGMMKDIPDRFPPFSGSLQIYVRDNQWAVFQIWETPTNRIVAEVSDDGDYVYSLDRFETNTGDFMPEDYSKTFSNGWIGQIYPAHRPFVILKPEAIALFYAYASSGYLDMHTNQIIGSIPVQPDDQWKNYEDSYAAITRSPPPLRLPAKIIFFGGYKLTNAVLTTSEFTNIANVQVPLKVSLVRYAYDSTNVLTTYEFQVTRISDKCPLKSFKPFLPNRAYVTDFRVPHFSANEPGSFRMVTNGWPAMRTD